MKKIFLIVFLIILTAGNSFGGSRIIKKLGSYLPSPMEIGWVANTVNTYIKAGAFIRSTNKSISELRNAKKQIEITGKMCLELWDNLSTLKDADLYDMNTWATPFKNASYICENQIGDIIKSYNLSESYLIDGAVTAYWTELEDINSFDIRYDKTLKSVVDLYLKNQTGKTFKKYIEVVNKYSSGIVTELSLTRNLLIDEKLSLEQELLLSDAQKAEVKLRIEKIEKNIESIDKKISYIQSNKEDENYEYAKDRVDRLLEFGTELISINLAQMQQIKSQASAYAKVAIRLKASHEKLRGGSVMHKVLKAVNTSAKEEAKKLGGESYIDFDKDIFDPSDPNKVPIAEVGKQTKPPELNKRDKVTEKDIIILNCKIDLALLKQEQLLRDLDIMKANTMAMLVAFEGFKKVMVSQNNLVMAHSASLLSNVLAKDLIKRKKTDL